MRLLNPGPVTLSEKVKSSLLKPDLCHREPEFAQLALGVIEKLKRVYPESQKSHRPVFLTGSGTSAVEMMVSSLTPKADSGKQTLVIANGVYGERVCAMLAIQGKKYLQQECQWTSAPDIRDSENILQSNPNISHVVVVHHETTTGRLNQLQNLGEICKRLGKHLLVDAVSSFGAEEIKFEEWNLQALAATANKCLHGVPGISFALVSESTLAEERAGTIKTQASSLYLDLFKYARDQEKGFSPFTQSVQCMYALDTALDEFFEQGGWESRRTRYRNYQQQVTETLKACGVQTLLNDFENTSCVLAAYLIPSSQNYQNLHSKLKEKGFTIYAVQAKFSGEIFRISTMGALTEGDISELCSLLRAAFQK